MQLSARAIIGIVAFSVAMSGLILGNMLLPMMVGEINRKRQDDHLISYFGFTLSKFLRILSEYRSLYPDGRLNIYYWIANSVGITGMIIVGVCIGIIG